MKMVLIRLYKYTLPFLLGAIVMILSISAQANQCKVNGCGSGWTSNLIPDEIKVAGINFTESCNNHDTCYSRCLECGINPDAESCDIDAEKPKRRKVCDVRFLTSMKSACSENGSVRQFVCNRAAWTYYLAVRVIGRPLFHGYIENPYERSSDNASIAAVVPFEQAQPFKPDEVLQGEVYKHYYLDLPSTVVESMLEAGFEKEIEEIKTRIDAGVILTPGLFEGGTISPQFTPRNNLLYQLSPPASDGNNNPLSDREALEELLQ